MVNMKGSPLDTLRGSLTAVVWTSDPSVSIMMPTLKPRFLLMARTRWMMFRCQSCVPAIPGPRFRPPPIE